MSHWTYLAIAALVSCGGLALMGLPGMLLVVAVQGLWQAVRRPLPDLQDKLWPLALVLTIYWGPLLYGCYWAVRLVGLAEWTTWPLWLASGLVLTTWMWHRTN